jgi:hypothetical protein
VKKRAGEEGEEGRWRGREREGERERGTFLEWKYNTNFVERNTKCNCASKCI